MTPGQSYYKLRALPGGQRDTYTVNFTGVFYMHSQEMNKLPPVDAAVSLYSRKILPHLHIQYINITHTVNFNGAVHILVLKSV